MAVYEQSKYCTNCKKTYYAKKIDKCSVCNQKLALRTWSVRFLTVENGAEKRKRLSGLKTKKEAHDEYVSYVSSYSTNQNSNLSLKYDDILRIYFQDNKKETKESTQYTKKMIFENYITPYFKNKSIQNITKADLVVWQNKIWNYSSRNTGKKLSYKYKKNIRTFLNHFLNFCNYMYNVPNLLKTVKNPVVKEQKKKIEFWEHSKFNNFIKYVDDDFWQTFYSFLFFTGCRIGETLAFSRNDLEGNIITIDKTLSRKTLDSANFKIEETKNSNYYTKPIPTILLNKLNKLIDMQDKLNFKSKFLFSQKKDIPLSEKMVARKLDYYINLANKSLGENDKLNRITPHGFRHSYVSMLIRLKINTKTIAELIGDTEEIVINNYSHLYHDEKQNTINLINDAVNNF